MVKRICSYRGPRFKPQHLHGTVDHRRAHDMQTYMDTYMDTYIHIYKAFRYTK